MSYQEKIKAIAEEREIKHLFHFTQLKNLSGILNFGLLPRQELIKSNHLAYSSSQFRLDDNERAISVSITRINLDMFATKRHKVGDQDWIVLCLSPEILWTLNCHFCWDSAAKNLIKYHKGWRGGSWAFSKMFEGSRDIRKGLMSNCPTTPEAEVQVLERIDSKYIVGAIVERTEMVESVQSLVNKSYDNSFPVIVARF